MIYDASNLKAIFFEKLPFKKLTVKYAKQLKPFKTGIKYSLEILKFLHHKRTPEKA